MLYKFVKYGKYFIITTYSHCLFQSWGRRENGIKRSCHLAILHRYSLNHIVQLPSHNPRPQVTISKKIQSTIICYVTWHIIRILLYKQQKLTVDYLIGKVTHGYLIKLLRRLEIKLQRWNIWQPEPQLNIHTTSLVRRQLPSPQTLMPPSHQA